MAAACSVGLTAYEEEWPDRCTPAEGGTLSVHNVKGRIDIAAWAGDYVEVRAVKRAGWHASDLEKVRIEIDRGTNVAIRSVYLAKNVDVAVDYTIRIPAGIELDPVENVTGDVQITGVSECHAVKTVTGRLLISSAAGPRRAESVTGNVEVRLSGWTATPFSRRSPAISTPTSSRRSRPTWTQVLSPAELPTTG